MVCSIRRCILKVANKPYFVDSIYDLDTFSFVRTYVFKQWMNHYIDWWCILLFMVHLTNNYNQWRKSLPKWKTHPKSLPQQSMLLLLRPCRDQKSDSPSNTLIVGRKRVLVGLKNNEKWFWQRDFVTNNCRCNLAQIMKHQF